MTTVSYDRYEHEVQTAVKSNINMLRVWGGGIYENDEFYELCNEYGLLVWQDFMFACSMYPGDEAFIENVKIEAEQNVKRLRNHPSIVLWCGNNEMDAAWSHYNENAGWGWKEQFPTEVRNEIWADYERIFHEVLPNVVEELSPNIDYWPSSPMCGITNDSNQHSFYESTSGDIHYWGVWHGEEPLENFNKYVGRFMSEYGFQSFPEPKTVLTYAEEEDMLLESEVMLHHQKNNRGNQLINEYMKKYYKEPKDFRSFLYMSQVLQAEAMKIAIESHRRHKPFCMGTIYWQMNDCWPVASWASMDYYGRWKAAQYIVKRSYQDIMVSCVENEQNVDIYVVSDKRDSFDGQLKVRLMTLDGELLHDKAIDIKIDSNSSKVILSLNRIELLKDYRTSNVLLSVQLMSAGMLVDDKQHYFTTTKKLELKYPTISVKKLDNNQFILGTDVLAKQVQLQTDDEGVFSDNYFDLVPGELKLVYFDKRISSDLKVSSMYDYVKEE
ncbi:MAG: hypothetical protein LRY71_05215 [Bacillaceae bacterium]|nr:hypothetical protein [Bacillaceae bacterium]